MFCFVETAIRYQNRSGEFISISIRTTYNRRCFSLIHENEGDAALITKQRIYLPFFFHLSKLWDQFKVRKLLSCEPPAPMSHKMKRKKVTKLRDRGDERNKYGEREKKRRFPTFLTPELREKLYYSARSQSWGEGVLRQNCSSRRQITSETISLPSDLGAVSDNLTDNPTFSPTSLHERPAVLSFFHSLHNYFSSLFLGKKQSATLWMEQPENVCCYTQIWMIITVWVQYTSLHLHTQSEQSLWVCRLTSSKLLLIER